MYRKNYNTALLRSSVAFVRAEIEDCFEVGGCFEGLGPMGELVCSTEHISDDGFAVVVFWTDGRFKCQVQLQVTDGTHRSYQPLAAWARPTWTNSGDVQIYSSRL